MANKNKALTISIIVDFLAIFVFLFGIIVEIIDHADIGFIAILIMAYVIFILNFFEEVRRYNKT